MDNNESEKKEIEFDDIDENGKVTKVKKNIEKKDNDIKVEEKKEEINQKDEAPKKEEIVYDDIDVNDKIRADEINNETRAKVRKNSKAIIKEILEWVLCLVIAICTLFNNKLFCWYYIWGKTGFNASNY